MSTAPAGKESFAASTKGKESDVPSSSSVNSVNSVTSVTSVTSVVPSRRTRPPWDKLLTASQRNDPFEIIRLVEIESVPPNHSNPVGQTALHVSALWGHVDCVRALVGPCGADPNVRNNITGATALHCAVQCAGRGKASDRIECARVLIEEGGADPTMEDMYGLRAVQYLEGDYVDFCGMDQDDVQMFRELLLESERRWRTTTTTSRRRRVGDNGEDGEDGGDEEGDNGQDDGHVVWRIFDAIRRADLDAAAEAIADAEARRSRHDVDDDDDDDDDDNDDDDDEPILERPDDATGFTPLLFVVHRISSLCQEDGAEDATKEAEVAVATAALTTPTATATTNASRRDQCMSLLCVAKSLLTAGCDPNAGPAAHRRKKIGSDPRKQRQQQRRGTRRLWRRPASVNDDETKNEEEDVNVDVDMDVHVEHNDNNDDGSSSPLHKACAALSSAYRKTKWRGLSSESADSDGMPPPPTPPHPIPILESLATLLVQYGASSSLSSSSSSSPNATILLLHDSARRDDIATVKFLIQTVGIDINAKGRQGMTAMHFAARSGMIDVVKWLLSYRQSTPMDEKEGEKDENEDKNGEKDEDKNEEKDEDAKGDKSNDVKEDGKVAANASSSAAAAAKAMEKAKTRKLTATRTTRKRGGDVWGGVADVSIKDDRGKTALDAARVNNRVEILALLEKAAAAAAAQAKEAEAEAHNKE